MIRVRQPDFCRVGRPDIREMVQLIRVDPDDPGALPDDLGTSNCSGFSLGDEFLGGNGGFSGQN